MLKKIAPNETFTTLLGWGFKSAKVDNLFSSLKQLPNNWGRNHMSLMAYLKTGETSHLVVVWLQSANMFGQPFTQIWDIDWLRIPAIHIGDKSVHQ